MTLHRIVSSLVSDNGHHGHGNGHHGYNNGFNDGYSNGRSNGLLGLAGRPFMNEYPPHMAMSRHCERRGEKAERRAIRSSARGCGRHGRHGCGHGGLPMVASLFLQGPPRPYHQGRQQQPYFQSGPPPQQPPRRQAEFAQPYDQRYQTQGQQQQQPRVTSLDGGRQRSSGDDLGPPPSYGDSTQHRKTPGDNQQRTWEERREGEKPGRAVAIN